MNSMRRNERRLCHSERDIKRKDREEEGKSEREKRRGA